MSDFICAPDKQPPHDGYYSKLGHTHSGGGGQAFPVGAVFLAIVATNPGTLLGYGTWSQISGGRFLVGQTGADADFDVAEEIGGAKTSTPSAHSGAAVDPHAAGNTGAASAGATQRGTTSSTLTLAAHTHSTPALSHVVTQPAAHAALPIVPPYFVVYLWKRTA